MSEPLDDLACRVRALVECDMVALIIGSPEENLRHPLLDRADTRGYHVAGASGAVERDTLLECERVRAACDLAAQTGRWQILALSNAHPFHSIMILPIECPAGVLGLVLCASARAEVPGLGERLLLQQYLSFVAHEFEQQLAQTCQIRPAANNLPAASGEREQYEFISMVSHELRRPITAIKGYAVLLQAYGCTAPEANLTGGPAMSVDLQRAYLDHIIEQTGHLETLAGDLLDVSRLRAGRLTLRFARVNVALLCRRVTQQMRDQVERQYPGRYTLRCVLPSHLPLVRADPDRLRQALTNLLDNAIKYSHAGGPIEVSVSLRQYSFNAGQYPLEQPVVQITVRDWGVGIPLEQQGQLFQPFSRLPRHSTRNIAGAGLGLYLSRQMVQAMRGTICISSKPGEGTSASIILPAFP